MSFLSGKQHHHNMHESVRPTLGYRPPWPATWSGGVERVGHKGGYWRRGGSHPSTYTHLAQGGKEDRSAHGPSSREGWYELQLGCQRIPTGVERRAQRLASPVYERRQAQLETAIIPAAALSSRFSDHVNGATRESAGGRPIKIMAGACCSALSFQSLSTLRVAISSPLLRRPSHQTMLEQAPLIECALKVIFFYNHIENA